MPILQRDTDQHAIFGTNIEIRFLSKPCILKELFFLGSDPSLFCGISIVMIISSSFLIHLCICLSFIQSLTTSRLPPTLLYVN